VRRAAAPAGAAPLRACRCESTAESGDDRSGTEDTSRAARATVPRYRAPKERHSTRHGSRATDVRGYPRDEPDEAPAQPKPTVLRSTPNVQSWPNTDPLRAFPECNRSQPLGIYETGSRACSSNRQMSLKTNPRLRRDQAWSWILADRIDPIII